MKKLFLLGIMASTFFFVKAQELYTMYETMYITPKYDKAKEFNEAFECAFGDEGYDTVGGLLLAEFGRVPERGEEVVLAQRFQFCVTAADNRRIIMLEMNDLNAE